MRITKSKIAVAGATAAVVALGGTAAYAYFTSTGTGTGNASVGTAAAWGVTVNSITGGPLFPGSGTETVNYTITNNSSGAVNLASVSAVINADVNGDNGATGCKASWFSISNLSGQPAGLVGPGGTNVGSFNINMAETGTNQDACQGAQPSFNISAS